MGTWRAGYCRPISDASSITRSRIRRYQCTVFVRTQALQPPRRSCVNSRKTTLAERSQAAARNARARDAEYELLEISARAGSRPSENNLARIFAATLENAIPGCRILAGSDQQDKQTTSRFATHAIGMKLPDAFLRRIKLAPQAGPLLVSSPVPHSLDPSPLFLAFE